MVLDILVNAGDSRIVGFVDSNRKLTGRRIDGIEVLGHPEDLPAIRNKRGVESAIVAIGDNGVRRAFAGISLSGRSSRTFTGRSK